MRTLTKILTGLIVLATLSQPLAAETTTVYLGGNSTWPDFLDNAFIGRGPGRLGREALVLSTKKLTTDADTDLLLRFDSFPFFDAAGSYSVISNTLHPVTTTQARYGDGAALCNTSGKGLVLRPAANSLFASQGDAGSFSIEFWLFPAVAENGSQLISWRSSRTENMSPVYQYIRAVIFNNHLEWTFSNIWINELGSPLDVVISGTRNLVPNSWSHHSLSYDALNGMLEYRMDGRTEEIKYITSSGRERGSIYQARFGSAADLEIASRFSGILDEFLIRRQPAPLPDLAAMNAVRERYPSSGGRFVTRSISAGGFWAVAQSLRVVKSEPHGTGTDFFVRAGETTFDYEVITPDWKPDLTQWQAVPPDGNLNNLRGKFFQIAGYLYTDGSGSLSPTVSEISLDLDMDDPPWPPNRVTAQPLNGAVELSWSASIDFDTVGYLVYYGERSWEYLAPGSPLDAGGALKATIGNLVNGKLYYFSIAAYDAAGKLYPGALSLEVFARPGAGR